MNTTSLLKPETREDNSLGKMVQEAGREHPGGVEGGRDWYIFLFGTDNSTIE